MATSHSKGACTDGKNQIATIEQTGTDLCGK